MFTHSIDPVVCDIGGAYLWRYGLSYTLGFLNMHLYLVRHRGKLGLTAREVYTLTLVFACGVLLGGRAIEVAFDEWAFYRSNPRLIPALWLGGMATHGLLIGAAAATWVFSRMSGKSFRQLADALVVPYRHPIASCQPPTPRAARRIRSAAVLPDDHEQLDAGRAGPLFEASFGAGMLGSNPD